MWAMRPAQPATARMVSIGRSLTVTALSSRIVGAWFTVKNSRRLARAMPLPLYTAAIYVPIQFEPGVVVLLVAQKASQSVGLQAGLFHRPHFYHRFGSLLNEKVVHCPECFIESCTTPGN